MANTQNLKESQLRRQEDNTPDASFIETEWSWDDLITDYYDATIPDLESHLIER